MDRSDPGHPSQDPRYKSVPADELPSAECLEDVVTRIVPYWVDHIAPDLLSVGSGGVLVPPTATRSGLFANTSRGSPTMRSWISRSRREFRIVSGSPTTCRSSGTRTSVIPTRSRQPPSEVRRQAG